MIDKGIQRALVAVVMLVMAFVTVSATAQQWQTRDPGFRVVGLAAGPKNTLWTCGSDGSIAVSQDDGAHWELRDQKQGGGLLLTLHFRGQFGYAAGTTDYIAFTKDGGASWTHLSIPYNDVLLASFSDSTHGLIRTRGEVLFTLDGKTWTDIVGTQGEAFTEFPDVMGLAALDAMHMAIHISEPPPSESEFLYTGDGGVSWKTKEIPSTTITSLLIANDTYWAVGTEVVHKDQPGGGGAVPLAIYSADGETWTHTQHDIAVCHWEGCGGRCTEQGCLAAGGLMLKVFDENADRIVFPQNDELTTHWAATDSSFCFVGQNAECVQTSVDPKADAKNRGRVPDVDEPPVLQRSSRTGPQCIQCAMPTMFVDQSANGRYQLQLTLTVDTNGLVQKVDIDGAPSKTLEENVRHAVTSWILVPAEKSDTPVNQKLKISPVVMVIRPN
jgi:hypothetical protein